MAELRKTQVLLEPEEYERLEEVATRRGISISELIRLTLRERYMPISRTRQEAAEAILRMKIPGKWGSWEEIETEIEESHDSSLP
ncbi:MAG TPA: ribbon-helix-helix protein, CopG family [Thermoanaerobaculia bacterium]|jgi:predicted DNA-binding ribbon-helix-helix protein|nr:ribbon-helix-helix protein, CopG family [Thermoanaerobaculia bacterium]